MTEAERLSLMQKSPESFSEPFSGELHDRHYGAVPANPYLNEEVKARQERVKNEFALLFENPPEGIEVPDSFKQMFLDDYYINVERRNMINYENFAKWRLDNPHVSHPDTEEAIQRVERGRAEAGDVLDVALSTELSGLEIGRVSHPYWQRSEYITPMRLQVASAIMERGGQLVSLSEPYRRIKIRPHVELNESTGEQDIIGFIIRYKRDVGSIAREDGSVLRIVERQVAAYRTDKDSGFRQDIIEAMKEHSRRKKNFSWEDTNDERFDTALINTHCKGYINKTIQTDAVEDFIVPESTTIYCYTEQEPTAASDETRLALGRVAYRAPDTDNGIAFYHSTKN